ncbi:MULTISPECIES: glycosyltransferase family 4 protein [Ralstonia]|uniref:Glycosyltransferase family 4 protein n=2 Tax=Ralstonia TaxID=48736 RepID=A0ABT2L4L9_9RALS|nr:MULTISPECIES: glycosyltransferase family 4 protein [Ralstonia]MCO5413245.1 glycosyltransferase family 4 protein [Ralstonia mojiangensis]MCT7297524.1 glycosyltransferase family 4 protein [Ralstonia mojiangensis]MCT7310116.1 glycosyltransferase family 4 protein [Ralstonia mojiangensis]CAJ0686522.1 hypothetical protein LMG18091_00601 [Ralstonia wenshanensis]
MSGSRKILFVLGGLAMGGVETYVVRLSKVLAQTGCAVDVILLSGKFDHRLMLELRGHARVLTVEHAGFLSASSWINAFIPFGHGTREEYDIVHVVDMLTLGFVFLNREVIQAKSLSIGIYHAKELTWWRDKSTYFRRKLLGLYDQNVKLSLFPSDGVAELAADLAGVGANGMHVLPLGVDLSKYEACTPARKSLKIVSVGRLVDFKTYNRHVITQLSAIRKFGECEYYVYGDGPEKAVLEQIAKDCGVADYVHFMGKIEYERLPEVLSGCFCFVGSGTSIIEASAAGVPSIVGIESIKTPHSCGFFSSVNGASYNEQLATDVRMPITDLFENLIKLSDGEYEELSREHRKKALEFDLRNTSLEFLRMSNTPPKFDYSFNRWRALASFFWSIFRFGPQALRSRFDHAD